MTLKSFKKVLAAGLVGIASIPLYARAAFDSHDNATNSFPHTDLVSSRLKNVSLSESIRDARVVVNSINLNTDSQDTIERKLNLITKLLDLAKRQDTMVEGPDTEDH